MLLYAGVAYFGLLLTLVLVLLFGNVRWCRHTPVGWMFDLITLHIPTWIGCVPHCAFYRLALQSAIRLSARACI